MAAIRLSALVTEDRQLIVQIPEDIPAGPVELVIQVLEAPTSTAVINPAREAARAKLAAAGMLSHTHRLPDGMIPPTEEEMLKAGILPPGARPSEELINEIREEN
jgi:hypothetical protein